MEQRQLDELYELASEHYLNGRFAEALQAWRQLLSADPADERAQEGIRLAELMAEGESEPAMSTPPAGVPVHAVPAVTSEMGSPGQVVEIEEDLLDSPSPEPEAETVAETGPSSGDEIDGNLAVLDSLSVPGMIVAPTARDEAHRKENAPSTSAAPAEPQGSSTVIDFGDLSELGAIPTVESPTSEPAPSNQTPAAVPTEASEPQVADLAPLSDHATFAPPPPEPPPPADDGSDPVAAELKKRIDDLMAEATGAVEEGRDEDALGLLSRVFILEEEHAGGRALEDAIKRREGNVREEIENWMTEAVQWLELGRVADARDRFRQVLAKAPDHLEAQDYLEKAEARLAAGDAGGAGEEFDATTGLGAAMGQPSAEESAALNHEPMADVPGVEGVPLAAPVGSAAAAEIAGEDDSAQAASTEPRPAPRRKMPVGIVLGMVVVVGMAAAAYLYGPDLIDRFFGAPDAVSPVAGPGGSTPTSVGEAGEGPTGAAIGGPVPGLVPEQRTARIGEALSSARDAMAASNYSAAIVSYNEVLSLDPGNTEARNGILDAGELYREQRAAAEQVERGRIALEDGDYVAALRIFYRVPAEVDQTRVARYKVIGWYNLGLIELKSADCDTALEHFDEALAIAPEEGRLLQVRDLADAYVGVPKDRDFYRQVEALEFLVP